MSADTLTALRLEVTGDVTSFRYPFFTQGFQPTCEMPPPSTIYGLLCSAVGDYLSAAQIDGLRFGYHFTHSGKFIDHKEHLHFDDPVQPFPFDRQLLFRPRLTLYLVDAPERLVEMAGAFQQPYYTLVLGRSQDLVSCQRIGFVALERAERGYFENTLLPLSLAPVLGGDLTSATMPRYIDPRRRAQAAPFALLRGRAVYPPAAEEFGDDEDDPPLMYENAPPVELWRDPDSPEHPQQPGLKRLIYLHSFRE